MIHNNIFFPVSGVYKISFMYVVMYNHLCTVFQGTVNASSYIMTNIPILVQTR